MVQRLEEPLSRAMMFAALKGQKALVHLVYVAKNLFTSMTGSLQTSSSVSFGLWPPGSVEDLSLHPLFHFSLLIRKLAARAPSITATFRGGKRKLRPILWVSFCQRSPPQLFFRCSARWMTEIKWLSPEVARQTKTSR